MKNLKSWIHEQGLRVQDAATELEINPTHLSDILSFQAGRSSRKKGVSLEIAARIESYTNREVTTDDILFPMGKPTWKCQRVNRQFISVNTGESNAETDALA